MPHAPAGYSGTPLLKKLGIKPEMKVWLLHAPAGYGDWLQADIAGQLVKKGAVPDFIHLFAKDVAQFEQEMVAVLRHSRQNRAITIWVSWYKKASGIVTDLTEDVIRQFALANGLVDVKVCAVSEQWSGLKLVVPLALR
jgi:hypothetical protein